MIDRHQRALVVDRRDRGVDRHIRLTDLVVHPHRRADRIRVPGIRRELDAGHEQELGMIRLDRADEIALAHDVVIRQLDEVEATPAGERRHLGDVRPRIAALARVRMEVAGVPARFGDERRAGAYGARSGCGASVAVLRSTISR